MIIIFVMYQHQTMKNKTIEHYQLESLLWTTPIGAFLLNAAEFWTASHKVLKKSFVVKKIKYQSELFPNDIEQVRDISLFDLAKIESSLLNLIRLEGTPKCHKLIRTTASAYIVLEQFKGKPLKLFLQTTNLSSHQLIELMISLAGQIEKYHSKGLTFYLLSIENIFIEAKNKIMFVDWTLARIKDSSEQKHQKLLKSLQQSPSFNISRRPNDFKADLYSLSNIFTYMLKQFSPSLFPKFQLFLTQMGDQQKIEININYVVKRLIMIKNVIDSQSIIDPCSSLDSKEIMNTKQLKKVSSGNIEYHHLIRDSCEKSGVRQVKTKPKQEPLSKSTSKHKAVTKRCSIHSISSKSEHSTSIKFIGKIILKRRSLAFFLISLSEFMRDHSLEISFMLLKKARCSFKSAQKECEKLKEQNQSLFQKVSALIISQIVRVQSLLSKLKLNLFELKLVGESKGEFTNIKSMVNMNYFTSKIKEFARSFMDSGQKSRVTFAQTVEIFYNIYMLTKTIEYGSYELFWDKTFKRRCIGNQDYFIQEKKFGLRYFKSKIQEILDKQQ